MKRFKRHLSIFLSAAMLTGIACAAPVGASAAQAGQSGDFTYSVIDGSAVITGYTGNAQRVVIPDTLDGYHVTSIGEFAFNDCQTLTEVSFGDSLESIGSFAFYECTGLKSIAIPENVTTIGDWAFYACESLESITVDENNPVYDSRGGCNVLMETGSDVLMLGCGNTVIPEDCKVIRDSAFCRCDGLENIKIPDSVETIEDEAFYWCSQLERVIIGDNVTSIGDRAFFMCPKLFSVVFGSGLRSIGEDAFFDCEMLESVTVPDGMTKISDCAFEHCLSMVSVTIPKSVTEIGQFAFGECRSLDYVYYAGSQSDWNKIAIDDGNFYLGIASFVFDTPDIDTAITPVRIASGMSGGEGIGKATVKTQSSAPIAVNMEKNFQFTVPSGVPLIGGGNVSLDLSAVPVSAKLIGEKLTVAIGINKSVSEVNEKTWSSFKNFVRGHSSDVKKGKELTEDSKNARIKTGLGKAFTFDFYGYFEATVKDGAITSATGLSRLKIEGSASGKWQMAVGFVPVVITVDGKVGADNTLNLTLDTSSNTLRFEDELKLTLPQITASAGAGIANVAEVSVYGEGKNEVIFTSNPQRITATLYGEVGVSVKALFYSAKKTLFKLKNGEGWTYYDSARKNKQQEAVGASSLDASDFVIDRSYLNGQSRWLSDSKAGAPVGAGSGTGFTYNTLQTSVYDGASPKLIATNDDLILIWVGDDPGRSSGNQTVVYYSLYNNETNTWSAPAAVEDNGTADFYPDIATDGSNTYLAWTDANTVFDENVTMEQMASSCEIKVAKFDPVSNTFGGITRLTDNGTLDIKPSVSVSGGKSSVVWKNNSANSLLSSSGTETVFRASEGSGGFAVNSVCESDTMIYELVSGGEVIAFSKDGDGDTSTADDAEIFTVDASNHVARLTENESNECHLAFSLLDGKNTLTYQNEGVLYGSADLQTSAPLTAESECVTGSYLFAGGRLYAVCNNENGSEIYAYSKDENSKWSNSVKISETGAYVRNPSIVCRNGQTTCAFLKSSAEIAEEGVTESTDLCCGVIPEYHAIEINDVIVDNGAESTDELPVTVCLTNLGTADETEVLVSITDGEDVFYSGIIAVDIKSGEKKEIEITVPLEKALNGKKSYTAAVTASGASDSKAFSAGCTQLQLTTKPGMRDGSLGLLANVENTSNIGTGAALRVLTAKDGVLLDTFSLNEIRGKQSLSFFIDNETLAVYKAQTETLYIELISYKDEEALADNTALISLDELSLFMLGDANRDGCINIRDVTQIQRLLAQYVDATGELQNISDLDNNGTVDVQDATMLQMILAEFTIAVNN